MLYIISLVILNLLAKGLGNYSSLLLANRRDIRLIEKYPPHNTTILIDGLDDVVALDFHFKDKLIFWTDVGQGAIRRAQIRVGQKKSADQLTDVKTIASLGIETPEGLACDWPRRNLYWSDSGTGLIEVSNFDGTIRKILYWKNLEQPLALALDPFHGYLFWTVWGEIPKIERASLDGTESSRRSIVSTRTYYPTGLAVDYSAGRLYWLDAKLSYVASVRLDGSDRRSVLQGGSQLPHPFSVTLEPGFGTGTGTIYWTDWNTRSVHSCSAEPERVEGGAVRETLVAGLYSPMDIHVYGPDAQPTCPNTCELNDANCSHLCLMAPWPPYYTCACPTGIKLLPDNKTCTSGLERMLLLARRTDIRIISLDTGDHNDVIIPVTGDPIKNAIAIDYDPVQGYVYWSDTVLKAIRRFKVDGSDHSTTINQDIVSPDGIAIDWVARNLYWTDAGLDRIQVSKMNGSFRLVIVDKDLDQPRGIALDPVNGYMYWSDWGDTPKLERAWLDGTHRQIIVKGDLGWPNGLVVDSDYRPDRGIFWKNPKVYWNDALRDRIEVVNSDGTGRKIILSTQIPHSFGFSMLGDHLYWTDWQRRSIERANKADGTHRQIIIDQLPDLMGLRAVDTLNGYLGTNRCSLSNANGGCSHYCFAIPTPSSSLGLRPYGPATDRAVCACPENMELTLDQKNCISPRAFLLFSRQRHVVKVSLGTSQPRQLTFSPKKYPEGSLSTELENGGSKTDGLPSAGGGGESGTSTKQASAIEVDVANGALFWTDIDSKTISRAFLNGSAVKSIVRSGLELPGSLALDWLAGNLYWTDMGTNRIEVARARDGSYRKVVVWKNLINPRSLATDPSKGLIYWSTWGPNPTIELANLDGTNRMTLVSTSTPYLSPLHPWPRSASTIYPTQNVGSKSGWFEPRLKFTSPGRANALTIDYGARRLYWVDLDNRAILSLALYGPSNSTITPVLADINQVPTPWPRGNLTSDPDASLLDASPHPFGLALFPNDSSPSLFWSDWTAQSIQNLRLNPGTSLKSAPPLSRWSTFLSGGLDYVVDMKVFHPLRQPPEPSDRNYCTRSSTAGNRTCEQLCIPSSPPGNKIKCTCGTHYTLSIDGTSCVGPQEYLLLGQDTSIYRIALDQDPLDMALPIGPIRGLKALAYDYLYRKVYWIQGETLLRKPEHGHGETEALVAPPAPTHTNVNRKNGVGKKHGGERDNPVPTRYAPFDMVINHVTRQLVWTCGRTEAIMVSWLDNGTILGAIHRGPAVKPRNLCFNHVSGHLFWVNERHSAHPGSSPSIGASSRIERLQFDGTRNTVIIATGLGRPTSLVCDDSTGAIFWADAGLGKVETADGLGGNRKIIADTALVNPRGLALTPTHIFWVDADLRKLESAHRVTGVRRTYGEVPGMGNPLYLLAVNHGLWGPSRQNYKYDLRLNPCSALYNSNGNCSHLCLPTNDHAPLAPQQQTGPKVRRCSCPLDLILENELSCKAQPTACASDHFACRSGPIDCVPVSWRCDGSPDCADRSDEASCGPLGPGSSSVPQSSRNAPPPSSLHHPYDEIGGPLEPDWPPPNPLGQPDLTPLPPPTGPGSDGLGLDGTIGSAKHKKSSGNELRYILSFVGALTLILLLAASYASYRHKCQEDDFGAAQVSLDLMAAGLPSAAREKTAREGLGQAQPAGAKGSLLIGYDNALGNFSNGSRPPFPNDPNLAHQRNANGHLDYPNNRLSGDQTSTLASSYGPAEARNGNLFGYNQVAGSLPPPPPPSLLSSSTHKRSSPFSSLHSGIFARINRKNRDGPSPPASFFGRYHDQLFGSRDRYHPSRRRRNEPPRRPRTSAAAVAYVSVASSPTRPPPPPTSVVTSASPGDGRRRQRNPDGVVISPPSLPAPANSCVDESLINDGADSSIYDRNHVTGASTSSSEPRATRLRPFRRRKKQQVYLLARDDDDATYDLRDDVITNSGGPRLPPAPPSSLCSSASRKNPPRRRII